MNFGPHYYVLRLGRKSHALLEAFRDELIDIQSQGFPVEASAEDLTDADGAAALRRLLTTVDKRFDGHYVEEPLMLVVVGDAEAQAVFASITTHEAAIVGRAEGDHTFTSPPDLGKIVWPIVKDAMSGMHRQSLSDLELASADGTIATGLAAVGQCANDGRGRTLMVEEGYRVRGSATDTGSPFEVSPSPDVRLGTDNVIDVIAERILAAGGNVVFMPHGALREMDRIALLLNGAEE